MAPSKYLDFLNKTYSKLHTKYENLFWISYMGDHGVDIEKDASLARRDQFRSNTVYRQNVIDLLKHAKGSEKIRLQHWRMFFDKYQIPQHALDIKKRIDVLESNINTLRSERKEGYIDPISKKFIEASELKMQSMIETDPDEAVRRACFGACENLAIQHVEKYIELIRLRNEFAQKLGYEDFYDYKVQNEEGMTKKELFTLFDTIHIQTASTRERVRSLEKTQPGILKPWNFSYMMAGNIVREEDQYFPFDQAISRWGESFFKMGIDMAHGTLQLDLMDRKGKWNNGFCHWPTLVSYKDGKRKPGTANFTCNVVAGQIGSGVDGYNTLFHEGGHAAHFLHCDTKDVPMNHEYAPMSMAWAETQSMFCDTAFSSFEWACRYAKNLHETPYPLALYEKKIKSLELLRPLEINGILFVSQFEKRIYETQDLDVKKVLDVAKEVYRMYHDRTEDSYRALSVPHIYSWESSGTYHGYGLAQIAVIQWRNYFYKKYGYIVDNPMVGKEMKKVWRLGSTKTFKEFVILATGKKLSTKDFIKDVLKTPSALIKEAKIWQKKNNTSKSLGSKKVSKKTFSKKLTNPSLNCHIKMVDGKKVIAQTKKDGSGFLKMAHLYSEWVKSKGQN